MRKELYLTNEGLIKIKQEDFTDDNIIRPYKGRMFNLHEPVKVYRNLHFRDKKIYSLKQGNKVVAHAERLCLYKCTYHVSEIGRLRILNKKRKEVIAYIQGYVTGSGCETTARNNNLEYEIKFNPYNNKGFVYLNKYRVKESAFTIIGEEVRTSHINDTNRIWD